MSYSLPETRRIELVEWVLDALSNREQEILEWICRGASNKEIAHHLGVSQRTVENHRKSITDRIGTGNTAQLVRVALLGF